MPLTTLAPLRILMVTPRYFPDMGGVETDLLYPREMPDLFRGTQDTLIGRYRNGYDVRNAVHEGAHHLRDIEQGLATITGHDHRS